MMDKVQKTTFTDYNAPSSEPFRLQHDTALHSRFGEDEASEEGKVESTREKRKIICS
jgi:hypothetical protein